MTRKILITGFLKTLSPLHISAPSNGRYDPSSGEKTWGDVGVPCNTIQTLGVPGVRAAKEGDGTVPCFVQVPVIAANNLAGRIRRRVAETYLSALAENGEPVSISTYNAIVCGAATGNPDGAPVTYDEYDKATQHVFLGIMGGGPRMMRRRAVVHNALANCSATADLLEKSRIPFNDIYQGGWSSFLRKHCLALPGYSLTQIWTYRRNDDLRMLSNVALASKSIADFETAFNERQAAIIEESSSDTKGASRTSTFTFQAVEFVPPGVSFPFVVELEEVSDEQAGLYFRGLENFLKQERLGGMGRNGFGEFVLEDGKITVLEDGEMSSTENFDAEDGFRMQAIAAWLDVAGSQKAADINELMRLPAAKDSKKPGKKGRKEAEAGGEAA